MLLMSWEAGQLCKKIQASWWGVVATSWWPRFRTQTHTHRSWSSVCNEVREVCGKRRMAWENRATRGEEASYFFHGSILLYSGDHRLDTWLPFGQQVVSNVLQWSTDTTVTKERCHHEEQLRDENLCLDKLSKRLRLPQIFLLFVCFAFIT